MISISLHFLHTFGEQAVYARPRLKVMLQFLILLNALFALSTFCISL